MDTTYYPKAMLELQTNMRYPKDLYVLQERNAVEHFRDIEQGRIVNETAVAKESENRQVDHYNHRMQEELVAGKSLQKSLEMWREISAFADEYGKEFEHVVFNGIGGSYLGPYMLIQSVLGDDFNAEQLKAGRPQLHFLANTDSRSFSQLVNLVPLSSALFVSISKSGSTAETATNTNTLLSLLEAAGLPPSRHCVAITVSGSALSKQAQSWLRQFPMEESTGGRTSICSAVAALPCAFAGVDFGQFLRGMSAMDEQTRGVDQNPALEIASLIDYHVEVEGNKNMITLGYSDALKQYSHYCQQLYMESLGKQYTRDGRFQPHGLTVFGGIGTAEQHAFMQQCQKGINDAFIKFIAFSKRGEVDYKDAKAGSMGRELLAFLDGTIAALQQNGRKFLVLTVEQANEYCLGQLIALEERIVSALAYYWGINAYDQPGVQDGKLAAGAVNKASLQLEGALRSGVAGNAEQICQKLDVPCDAWIAESILSDMCANPQSYFNLKARGSREWRNNEFIFAFE